jgi:Right handed beta helix region
MARILCGSRLLLGVLVMCGSSIGVGAVAATLYVGTNGLDTNANNTTNTCQIKAFPCATISHAASLLSSGDTLSLLAGTYTEGFYNAPSNGGSDPITVKAEFPGTAVIQPVYTSPVSLGDSSNSNITFDGIIFDGSSATSAWGVWLEPSSENIRFINCEVRKSDLGCVYLASDGNSFVNTSLHDCGEDGIRVYGSHNRVDRSDVYRNGENNITILSGTTDDVVRFSKVHDSVAGIGIEIIESSGHIAHDNEIYGNSDDGVFIYATSGSNAILHNAIYQNSGWGIVVGSGSSETFVINNICYENVSGGISDDGTDTTLGPNYPPP